MLYSIVLAFAICQHESAVGTHTVPPSWGLPPPHPTPLAPDLSSCVTQQVPAGWLVYVRQCVCVGAPLCMRPTLSSARGAHKSLLYVCVPIVALQRGSAALFLDSIHVLVNDICLSLSDLTSLCIIGSRFIHLI